MQKTSQSYVTVNSYCTLTVGIVPEGLHAPAGRNYDANSQTFRSQFRYGLLVFRGRRRPALLRWTGPLNRCGIENFGYQSGLASTWLCISSGLNGSYNEFTAKWIR